MQDASSVFARVCPARKGKTVQKSHRPVCHVVRSSVLSFEDEQQQHQQDISFVFVPLDGKTQRTQRPFLSCPFVLCVCECVWLLLLGHGNVLFSSRGCVVQLAQFLDDTKHTALQNGRSIIIYLSAGSGALGRRGQKSRPSTLVRGTTARPGLSVFRNRERVSAYRAE